jgi:general secretion pathway protein A
VPPLLSAVQAVFGGSRAAKADGAAPAARNPPPAAAMPVAAAVAPSMASAVAAPLATPVSLNELLLTNTASTTDAAAYRRLLALWGTTLPEDREPCAQAAKAGLACLDQRGSWAQVRVLNRPAILTLSDDQGGRHRVVLRNLDGNTATLVLGERDVRVPLDQLSGVWFGEFTVVWKPKTQRPRDLSVGMSGDQVRWLRRSLAALHGASSDPDRGDTYDQDLATAVQNFQREHRLNVDGIAGIQTQVVLDTALAEPGSPLLLPAAPRGG